MEYEWFNDYVEQIKKRDIEAAKKIIMDAVPSGTLLYKYCKGLKRDILNMSNQKLWLSNVCSFNDPYDSAIMVDCGVKLQYPKGQIKQALEDWNKQMEENKRAKELQSSLFVSCFSRVKNSFPMWGYYADGHRGLRIGYDLQELVSRYDCFPVIYTSELTTYTGNDSDKNILLSPLTKSDEWKHECEWRIIRQSDEDKGKNGICLEKFAKPREIVIGCKRDISKNSEKGKADDECEDFNEIEKYADSNHVDLYYSLISQREYKLIDEVIKLNR